METIKYYYQLVVDPENLKAYWVVYVAFGGTITTFVGMSLKALFDGFKGKITGGSEWNQN